MSTIKVDTWQDTNGNENFPCTAWVNFIGTGTVSIRDGGNVSSITDNGTGIYTINFATSMANANYSPVLGRIPYLTSNGGNVGAVVEGDVSVISHPAIQTVSALQVAFYANLSAKVDADTMYVSIFGGR